jgi:hypothetical protein
VLARTEQVLIVQRARGRLPACQRETGHRTFLSPPTSGILVDVYVDARPLAVAGTLVALRENIYVPRGDLALRVAVVDTRNGRRLVDCDAYATYFWQVGPAAFELDSALLQPDGLVAWSVKPPVPVGLDAHDDREVWWGAHRAATARRPAPATRSNGARSQWARTVCTGATPASRQARRSGVPRRRILIQPRQRRK